MNRTSTLLMGALLLAACGGGGGDEAGQTGGTAAGGAGGTATGGATGDGGAGGGSDGSSACHPVAPCPSGWYLYSDTVCSPPYLGSGAGCNKNGDDRCYPVCAAPTDCKDPRFPTCGSVTVFGGSDAGRQKPVCLGPTRLPACTIDAGASSPTDACAAAILIACGDRLSHSTTTEGRPNLWGGYAKSARAESGRETVYAFIAPANCGLVATLDGLTTDLDLALLSGCDPLLANVAISSTPLDLQTVETVWWTSTPGAVSYLVVDGYAGAEGSYSLTVDCTCE